LLLAGALRPAPFVALAGALAALLVAAAAPVLRAAPAAPPWSVAALLVVALGFGLLALATSSEHLLVRRDPGAYALTADWLSRSGRLPIPAHRDVFGGPAPGLRFAGPGSFAVGDAVVPQFMTGLPLALTPLGWLFGIRGVLTGTALLATAALLAAGGLIARLVAPRWAPLAAFALALTLPQLHTARSAFSEPAAQLLVLAALGLLAVGASPRAALLAGLLTGLVVVVRLEGLLEVGLLLPVAGLLARRDPARARALVAGLVAGSALGVVDGVALSRPYLAAMSPRLSLLAAGVAAAALLGLVVARWPRRLPPWAPAVGAALPVTAAVAAYAVRPLLTTSRMPAGEPAADVVAGIQARLGLPVDGQRTYAELSLHWVAWYVGVAGLALGVAGLALLTHRALRNRDLALAPTLVVLLGATAVVLWRPEITPDQPWAARRLVPAALPAVLLGALAAAAVLAGRARWLGGAAAAALVVPTALTTAALAGAATERGELTLLRRTCAALPARAAVLVIGAPARDELPLALRVRCGVPVAVATAGGRQGGSPALTAGTAAATRAAGRVLVLVGTAPEPLRAAGGVGPRRLARLTTREVDRTLLSPPRRTLPLRREVWLADPAPAPG
jgi:hypothetical protein